MKQTKQQPAIRASAIRALELAYERRICVWLMRVSSCSKGIDEFASFGVLLAYSIGYTYVV